MNQFHVTLFLIVNFLKYFYKKIRKINFLDFTSFFSSLDFLKFSDLLLKERLAVSTEDIWYHFIYQIGVIMDDHDPTDRQVEITYIAHHIKEKNVNMEKAIEKMQDKLWSEKQNTSRAFVETMEEIEGPGPELLVYRFIRNYTKGVEDSWTINGINHKSVKDIRNEIKKQQREKEKVAKAIHNEFKEQQREKEKVAKATKRPPPQPKSKVPTHYSKLDPESMNVGELQHELGLRGLSTKGQKKVLKIRLQLVVDHDKKIAEKKSNQTSIRKSTRNK